MWVVGQKYGGLGVGMYGSGGWYVCVRMPRGGCISGDAGALSKSEMIH